MVIQNFQGNLAGLTLTDTSGPLKLQAAPGQDVIIRLSDALGSKKLVIRDSTGTTVATISSDGVGDFESIGDVSLAYTASPGAGSIAASCHTIYTALDTLFSGGEWAINLLSPTVPDGHLTTFETPGRVRFRPGTTMLFQRGLKQRPGVDYAEHSNGYSVIFAEAPGLEDNVEFTFLRM